MKNFAQRARFEDKPVRNSRVVPRSVCHRAGFVRDQFYRFALRRLDANHPKNECSSAHSGAIAGSVSSQLVPISARPLPLPVLAKIEPIWNASNSMQKNSLWWDFRAQLTGGNPSAIPTGLSRIMGAKDGPNPKRKGTGKIGRTLFEPKYLYRQQPRGGSCGNEGGSDGDQHGCQGNPNAVQEIRMKRHVRHRVHLWV